MRTSIYCNTHTHTHRSRFDSGSVPLLCSVVTDVGCGSGSTILPKNSGLGCCFRCSSTHSTRSPPFASRTSGPASRKHRSSTRNDQCLEEWKERKSRECRSRGSRIRGFNACSRYQISSRWNSSGSNRRAKLAHRRAELRNR